MGCLIWRYFRHSQKTWHLYGAMHEVILVGVYALEILSSQTRTWCDWQGSIRPCWNLWSYFWCFYRGVFMRRGIAERVAFYILIMGVCGKAVIGLCVTLCIAAAFCNTKWTTGLTVSQLNAYQGAQKCSTVRILTLQLDAAQVFACAPICKGSPVPSP